MDQTEQLYCFNPSDMHQHDKDSLFQSVYEGIEELRQAGHRVSVAGFNQSASNQNSLQVILSITAPPDWHTRLETVMARRGIRCAPFDEALRK